MGVDTLWVDEKLVKEEEEAAAARVKEQARQKAQAKGAAPKALDSHKLAVLDQLLNQAQMFSQFLTEQVQTHQAGLEIVRSRLPQCLGTLDTTCYRDGFVERFGICNLEICGRKNVRTLERTHMMYLFTIVPHPHGHWQLQELPGNQCLLYYP